MKDLQQVLLIIVTSALGLSMWGCGDAGTGVSNPPTTEAASITTPTNSGAAVAALFGSSTTSTSLSVKFLTKAQVEAAFGSEVANALEDTSKATSNEGTVEDGCIDPEASCTCSEALGLLNRDGSGITSTAYTDPDFFGSLNSGITLSAEHFCALPSAPTTLNTTSTGFDRNGLFAVFTINTGVDMTCVETSTSASLGKVEKATVTRTYTMQTGSTGIWRNVAAANASDGLAHEPEIHGTFNIAVNGTDAGSINCSIVLGTGEEVLSSDCSDSDGNALALTTATCTVDDPNSN